MEERIGRWKYQTLSVPGGKGQTYSKWSCSVCKAKQHKRSKYCPECGSRMIFDGGGVNAT